MNYAHIHLFLNHIPVVGIPIALMFTIFALIKSNKSLQRFSQFVLLGLAICVLPVYLTGEPAEEVVENLQGISSQLIEDHEEAATLSLILTLMIGGIAVVGLWFGNDEKKARLISLLIILISFLSILALGYTAFLGGKIRHTEFQQKTSYQGQAFENKSTKEFQCKIN
jgi:uncharacterized membrane protein